MGEELILNRNSSEFREENEKLETLVREIDNLLRNYKFFLPYPEINSYSVANDYDEVDNLRFKKQQNEQYYDRTVKPWKDNIDSPYFGRIDLEINGDFRTMYIGNKDLYDENDKLIVVSGNSDLAKFFYQYSLGSATEGKNRYEAFLRRRLLISNRELKMVTEVFSKGIDVKYSGITDPYLAEILRRNRRETKMFPILSSIQENQFNIIDQNYKNSFIVQEVVRLLLSSKDFQELNTIIVTILMIELDLLHQIPVLIHLLIH